MPLNLATFAHNSARYFPEETALIHDERRLNYRELQRQIEEVMLQLPERSGAFAVSNRDNAYH